jgi:hypothetical protein
VSVLHSCQQRVGPRCGRRNFRDDHRTDVPKEQEQSSSHHHLIIAIIVAIIIITIISIVIIIILSQDCGDTLPIRFHFGPNNCRNHFSSPHPLPAKSMKSKDVETPIECFLKPN